MYNTEAAAYRQPHQQPDLCRAGHLLGDVVLATALLDRLLHHAEVVAINGRSYRMRQRLGADQMAAALRGGNGREELLGNISAE